MGFNLIAIFGKPLSPFQIASEKTLVFTIKYVMILSFEFSLISLHFQRRSNNPYRSLHHKNLIAVRHYYFELFLLHLK